MALKSTEKKCWNTAILWLVYSECSFYFQIFIQQMRAKKNIFISWCHIFDTDLHPDLIQIIILNWTSLCFCRTREVLKASAQRGSSGFLGWAPSTKPLVLSSCPLLETWPSGKTQTSFCQSHKWDAGTEQGQQMMSYSGLPSCLSKQWFRRVRSGRLWSRWDGQRWASPRHTITGCDRHKAHTVDDCSVLLLHPGFYHLVGAVVSTVPYQELDWKLWKTSPSGVLTGGWCDFPFPTSSYITAYANLREWAWRTFVIWRFLQNRCCRRRRQAQLFTLLLSRLRKTVECTFKLYLGT